MSIQVPELEAHAAGLVKNLFLKVRRHTLNPEAPFPAVGTARKVAHDPLSGVTSRAHVLRLRHVLIIVVCVGQEGQAVPGLQAGVHSMRPERCALKPAPKYNFLLKEKML